MGNNSYCLKYVSFLQLFHHTSTHARKHQLAALLAQFVEGEDAKGQGGPNLQDRDRMEEEKINGLGHAPTPVNSGLGVMRLPSWRQSYVCPSHRPAAEEEPD